MRNVLIVAYYFPPLGGIGSIRVSSFATHLPEFGWEPTVLAPRNGAYYRDPTLSFPEERVVRTGSLELSRTGKRLLRTGGNDVVRAEVGNVKDVVRGFARRTLYYPDAQAGWLPAAVLKGRKVLRRRHFDAIFSSAYPPTAHFIAERLRARSSLPWVAEYRDPWADLITNPRLRQRAQRAEARIAAKASALVMTAPSWSESHAERWGRSVDVITNGCDGPIPTHPLADRFVLAHLGSMFPERQDFRAVWRAIRERRGAADAVDCIRFIGNVEPQVREELSAAGILDLVEETGFQSRAAANQLLGEASALLLAGPRDAREELRGWIPAKLFEYLATDLPIIYVGHPAADAARLLRQHPGCHILNVQDAAAIADALLDSRRQRYVRDIEPYTRRALSGRLAQLLDAAVGGRREATTNAVMPSVQTGP